MNTCPPEGVVFDPFAGSGSTLIGAEQSGRTCHAIEIEPQYCQVVIDRWEAFTGQKAQPL
jgi:DNA modification methylase